MSAGINAYQRRRQRGGRPTALMSDAVLGTDSSASPPDPLGAVPEPISSTRDIEWFPAGARCRGPAYTLRSLSDIVPRRRHLHHRRMRDENPRHHLSHHNRTGGKDHAFPPAGTPGLPPPIWESQTPVHRGLTRGVPFSVPNACVRSRRPRHPRRPRRARQESSPRCRLRR